MPKISSGDPLSQMTYPTVLDSFKEAFSSAKQFRVEILAGLATSFALIPEVISFAILAGVSPAVGLFSTVVLLSLIHI